MPRGVRKPRNIDELLIANERKIEETEQLLQALNEERIILLREKRESELSKLENILTENNLSIEDAVELIRNMTEKNNIAI